MASKKRQTYREWHTKAIVSHGKEITSDQLNALDNIALYEWILQPIITQIRHIFDEKDISEARINLLQWYDDQRRLLIIDQSTCIIWLLVHTTPIKAALHDLFQWSRVEKIRQNRTNNI